MYACQGCDMQNKTFSISILSGKGGVGKTNLALNLGYALFKLAQPAMLMDCDLGLANLDVLLGITPDKNLQDILRSDASPEQIIVHLETNGFDLIPAASGVPELVDLDEDLQLLIFQKLEQLFKKYNFLLMDIGAGISQTVLSFARTTHHRILIVTPEPTSLTDGYALIKVLHTKHNVKDFWILVNMVESEKEALMTFERLRAACDKFLKLPVNFLGFVRNDSKIPEAVRRQIPFLKYAPSSPGATDIFFIAKRLMEKREQLLSTIYGTPVLKMDF